uniref:Uncharacterized protein n=1 Tax=Pithovirus LCDPAC02 TaxID=2506601 RepID=A0A481YPB2_9VIRU|nr:MAG: hypothetical protein LCDPAC02_00990 [Pithovirus LCDPAC02]
MIEDDQLFIYKIFYPNWKKYKSHFIVMLGKEMIDNAIIEVGKNNVYFIGFSKNQEFEIEKDSVIGRDFNYAKSKLKKENIKLYHI